MDVWTLALERVDHIWTRFDQHVVMFSGGKDSTATLNAVRTVAERRDDGRPFRVAFFDEEAIPDETVDYVRRTAARTTLDWYCVPLRHRNVCSRIQPWWWPWAPESEHVWCRPKPSEAVTLPGFPTNPAERLPLTSVNRLRRGGTRATQAVHVGIRAAESINRLNAVNKRRTENYVASLPDDKGMSWRIAPIYDWTTADIWTAADIHGWDYNRAYDQMEMAGIPHAVQRIAPPFGEEPSRSLWMFPVCFPDLWARMETRVPGAATAARYAATDLYGYGHPPEPSDPEEAIRRTLDRWEPDIRTVIAAHIRAVIAAHYAVTADPILWAAPHPDTGVTWRRLVQVATRGYLKSRNRVTVMPVSPVQYAATAAAYAKARHGPADQPS